ncbi:MAG: EscU/YscU/HrcU family type III secretion system export apparatus switch protein [Ruminococcaceae bacterium]|nr:EscU/YscU/HrcU family type III secretion system export apparatus switch protein [Oscillospiraceae bacterium]
MGKKARKAAATTALALLTAASVVTGSLFDSPAALLPEDGAPSVVYNMTTGLDGADDDDAGTQEDESEETRRRVGVRAALRARILRLPLAVRLLVVLPLWAAGSVILAAAGAAWTLLQPVMGKLAGFAVMLALLVGAFLLAAKAVFPDLPLKKVFSRRSLVALLLGAAGLTAADAVLGVSLAEYEQIKTAVLSVGFFVVLSCAAVPFALREQRRRLEAPPPETEAKEAKKPETLTFTDAGGTFTVRVPNVNG